MKSSFVGTVLSIILVSMLLIVTPIYYIGIVEWARAESEVSSDVRNLVDQVIDTRQLTEDMLADFNLSLASKSSLYRCTITRELRVINPDPAQPGETYSSYMISDNISQWNQGDIITVYVEAVGSNIFRSVSKTLLGLDMLGDSFQYCGRVR